MTDIKNILKIICGICLIALLVVPCEAQIVLSVNQGRTFQVTLTENPKVGCWTLSTTSGLKIDSDNYKDGFLTLNVKATKLGLQTIQGVYAGKNGKITDRISKTVNVIT
jgi:predicted secreted protein